MKKIFSTIFLVLFLFSLFPHQVEAGLVPCGRGTSKPACEFCDFFVLFQNIVNFVLFEIAPPLAILMIVIAGAMFMLAHFEVIGDPNWITQARSLLWSVVMGLIIIYGAWVIVNLFFQVIGISTATNNPFKELPENWWKINCNKPP